MSSSTTPPPPPASAGPALFHAAIARHRETWTRRNASQPALISAPTRVLRVVNGDSPVASSPDQSPADHNALSADKSTASPSAATTSDNRDSLFSVAEDHSSYTSGDKSSYYFTARSSASLSIEDFPIRRHDSDVISTASSEEFPMRRKASRRDSATSSGEFPTRRNNPSRLTSDLGSDSSAAVAASLAENRRIFAEGFARMAAHQAQLEALAQTILDEKERVRSEAVRVAGRRSALRSRRATTEREAMQVLVEAVPFSADGRGHCDEAEVRRVALRGARWSMMSDSPYPRHRQTGMAISSVTVLAGATVPEGKTQQSAAERVLRSVTASKTGVHW
jgi:hypothetical protein